MPLFADITWQPIIAYALVAFAAAWVARRMWRVFRRATRGGGQSGPAAGGCGACPQNSSAAKRTKAKPLVQLNSPPRKTDSA